MTGCIVAKDCRFNWVFSKLNSLVQFKLSDMALTENIANDILNSLPKTLKSLDFSLRSTILWDCSRIDLPALEELTLENVDVETDSDCAESVLKMTNLKSVHFSHSNLAELFFSKLKEFFNNRTDFLANEVIFHSSFPVENLLALNSLENLDLSSSEISCSRSY